MILGQVLSRKEAIIIYLQFNIIYYLRFIVVGRG